jgi:hypothetical protein
VSDHSACDVCSRTILKGEQVHEYVTPQGQRHGVCVLCRQRAEASGWIPAEQYGAIARQPPNRARRGQALRERLGRAASRARTGVRASRGPADPDDRGSDGAARGAPGPPSGTLERQPVAHDEPAQSTQRQSTKPPPASESGPAPEVDAAPEPAARPRQQAKRRPTAVPPASPARQAAPRPRRGPEAIMRSAVERFNSSDDRRKVGGLIRSLGEPRAAVVPNPERQLALVTVAWELSWYQWEVNGEDDDSDQGAVREVAKGDELSELAEEARSWNAAVGEDGGLRLRSSDRGRASAPEA